MRPKKSAKAIGDTYNAPASKQKASRSKATKAFEEPKESKTAKEGKKRKGKEPQQPVEEPVESIEQPVKSKVKKDFPVNIDFPVEAYSGTDDYIPAANFHQVIKRNIDENRKNTCTIPFIDREEYTRMKYELQGDSMLGSMLVEDNQAGWKHTTTTRFTSTHGLPGPRDMEVKDKNKSLIIRQNPNQIYEMIPTRTLLDLHKKTIASGALNNAQGIPVINQSPVTMLENAYTDFYRAHFRINEDGTIRHNGRDATYNNFKKGISNQFTTNMVNALIANCPKCEARHKKMSEASKNSSPQKEATKKRTREAKLAVSNDEPAFDDQPPVKKSKSQYKLRARTGINSLPSPPGSAERPHTMEPYPQPEKNILSHSYPRNTTLQTPNSSLMDSYLGLEHHGQSDNNMHSHGHSLNPYSLSPTLSCEGQYSQFGHCGHPGYNSYVPPRALYMITPNQSVEGLHTHCGHHGQPGYNAYAPPQVTNKITSNQSVEGPHTFYGHHGQPGNNFASPQGSNLPSPTISLKEGHYLQQQGMVQPSMVLYNSYEASMMDSPDASFGSKNKFSLPEASNTMASAAATECQPTVSNSGKYNVMGDEYTPSDWDLVFSSLDHTEVS